VITLDTSGVLALLNPRDRNHRAASEALAGLVPSVVPAPALSEMTHVIGLKLGRAHVVPFLRGFAQGDPLLDCADQDLPRTVELLQRFSDLQLGFADAAVIACAERNGGAVLTFDRRGLEVIARDVPITLVPGDVGPARYTDVLDGRRVTEGGVRALRRVGPG
jgi:uncharacterized protein